MAKTLRKYDHLLLFSILALLLVGVVMISSNGVFKSIDITAPRDLAYPDCGDPEVDCYWVLKNHLIRVGIGLAAMLVAWKIPYKFWKTMSPLMYVGGVALLIFVLFGGDSNNTFSQSWINTSIPLVNSVQPSEIAKLGLIVYLSFFLSHKMSSAHLQSWQEGFLKFALIAGLVVFPVVMQPDYGSAMVIVSIASVIYFLAGASWKHFAAGFLIAVVGASLALQTSTHSQERVQAFLNPDPDCGMEECWQKQQALIAVGTGGFFGRGITQGIQKSHWLPQAVDDFIFAASAEELGFLRTAAVVGLYMLLAYRGFLVASHAPNKFAMLLAAGISTWVSAQAFINIMVNIGLFPITGITLPFMSYGGSSMVVTLFAVGILLNISKYTTQYAYSPDRRRYRRTHRTQPRSRRRLARTW